MCGKVEGLVMVSQMTKRSNESRCHRRELKNDRDHEMMLEWIMIVYSHGCGHDESRDEEGHWTRLKED